MTEKTVDNIPKGNLHILAFLLAFAAAPLLVTGVTYPLDSIPYYALMLGGPYYALLGGPILALYLRRHPPAYLPIILCALVAVLCTIPVFVALTWWYDDWDALQALPLFLGFGALFATLWSATFAFLYRSLLHLI